MGIVRFALRFPHTFYVLAGMVLFLGCSAILVTPKDIFPAINIPVVTVIWQYTGLSPEEMEQRVTTYSEYTISANVGNIRNIESQTLEGFSVEKIFFQPNVSIDLAISQIVSATDSIRVVMPIGIQPPIIVQYNASSVPVVQLSLSSYTLNEQQLYDYWSLPDTPGVGADPRHHAAGALWRQIPANHGRPRPRRIARARHHAERRSERG
jgi:multidrug efflux pump subunit AcrB